MQQSNSNIKLIALGLFVVAALGAGTAGVFAVGKHGGLFTQTYTLKAAFPTIGGVQQGTRVRIQGIDAGIVSHIEPPAEPGKEVVLTLQIDVRFLPLVRRDAVAQLATQGIIGERVVEIAPGSAKAESARPGESIQAEPPLEISQLLADAQRAGQQFQEMSGKLSDSLEQMNSIGGQVKQTLARLDTLAAQVEAGQGSVGRFVMSDEAHDSALELMKSGEQTMTTLHETVLAARRVWPLRDYFMAQGLSNPVEIMFRPGSKREMHMIPANELFKPGTSILTDAGKKKLDVQAEWLNKQKISQSEIVVAAFNQDETNSLKAQRLTQEQATAVRDYLVNLHSVQKLSFWSSRQVEAAGFGHSRLDDQAADLPAQRIELVLFTPAK